ncbi:hypothetical protein ONZ45_g11527 [Pleurotus djamor]|nr:hypothetical protein ONZ45_g11527 [Pleurotus djamor]
MAPAKELPIELWKIVFLGLGSPHRNALLSAALVSHALCDLATPIIYDFIVIDDKTSKSSTGTWSAEESTIAVPARVHLLRHSLMRNCILASHVHSFAELALVYDDEKEGIEEEEEDLPEGESNIAGILSCLSKPSMSSQTQLNSPISS